MSIPQPVPILLQEVCLSPDIDNRASVVSIDTSNNSQSLFSSSRKRHFDEVEEYNEESYARKHLASETAVYFRKKEHYPRTILWRLLDERHVLEVQSVDLVQGKQRTRNEARIAFRIALPAAAIKDGVTLADTDSGSALEVFVLTSAHDLYTITLKRDLLLKGEPPQDFDPSSCIQKHSLSSLSFRSPFKFTAVNATELLITLQDGGLVRLERDSPSHSAPWKETFFSEGGWSGTLRGLIPLKRHNTVRHGDLELEPTAAIGVAMSPDQHHIWTVTLEHDLVAWSTRTGKAVLRRDVLEDRNMSEAKKGQSQYLMPADQGDLLKVFGTSSSSNGMTDSVMAISDLQYQLVVYSPKVRAFNLFFAKTGSGDDNVPRLYDVMEGEQLSLPFDDLLDTNLWRCTEYQCKVDPHWQTLQLWTTIQCGDVSKLYTITLDLFRDGELTEDWQQKWQNAWTVVAEPVIKGGMTLPELAADDSTSVSRRWLEYLFYPGRYTVAELETALSTYRTIRKLPSRTQPSPQNSLEERLMSAISAKILVPPNDTDFRGYYSHLQEQWHAFHSILLDLHLKGMEWRGVALDHDNDMAWISRADLVGPVRAIDHIERSTLNAALIADEEHFAGIDSAVRDSIEPSAEAIDLATLLAAARGFSEVLPPSFRQSFTNRAIQKCHSRDQNADRASVFFSETDVGQYVSDDAYQVLETALQPLDGIASLTNDLILSAIAALNNDAHRGVSSHSTLDQYGINLMIASGQSFIRQNKQILLDLLMLVSFIHNDFDAENLDQTYDAQELFHQLVVQLRNTELRDWLTRNVCSEPQGHSLITITIFQAIFLGDWDSHVPKSLTLPEQLTHWSRQWTLAAPRDWHDFTFNVFAALLRRKLYDLAADFSCFLQESPWTSYLRARLQLAIGNQDEAIAGFRAAASGLSGHLKGDINQAGFLSAEELSNFGQGPEMYYLHVANLFEKLRLYSSTADFAAQAMSYIDEERVERDIEQVDGRKLSTQSRTETIANARAEIKLLKTRTTWEELVSRRFNALVQTGRYAEAYTTLQKFKSQALLKDNLKKLIDHCVKNNMLEIVLELPLGDNAADIADTHLLSLAKKAMSSGDTMQSAQNVLFALRIKRGDFRAAAQVLYEHLERLRFQGRRRRIHNPENETLIQAYLTLINTLGCCGEGEEWLLAEPIAGVHPPGTRRKLVKLDDVRADYVAELDRRSDLLHGRFPVIGADDDDDEMEYF